MKKIILVLPLLLLTACATIHINGTDLNGNPFSVAAAAFGTTQALDAFTFDAAKDSRHLSIGKLTGDVNVQAIDATSGAIGVIVGDALKAYLGQGSSALAGDALAGIGELVKGKIQADLMAKKLGAVK